MLDFRLKVLWFSRPLIGGKLFKVDRIDGHLDRGFFMSHKSCSRSYAFINLREVLFSCRLQFLDNALSRIEWHIV